MKLIQALKTVTVISFVSVGLNVYAGSDTPMENIIPPQGTIIPFDSSLWHFKGNVQVEEYLGQTALNLGIKKTEKPGGLAVALLKGIDFQEGIIEYDVAFGETRTFAGLRFRGQPDSKYETFYMRAHQSGNPDANQYMTVYNEIDSWQLDYGEQYSTPKKYSFNEWMHVKIVVSGKLADIYIKEMETPALTVALSSATESGQLGLWGLNLGGDVRFANFSVKKAVAPVIKGIAVLEKPAKPSSVLSWSVSNTFSEQLLMDKIMLSETDTTGLKFQTLKSEFTGITKLAKLHGLAEGKDTVFAKVVITSTMDQVKKFDFGFSNKVKVYLNKQILFAGSDLYMSRDYRFLGTIGFYDSVYLPLKKGNNELLLAVTASVKNPTGGWGIQARFDNLEGITLQY